MTAKASRVYDEQMNTYKVPDSLLHKYTGSGYALAAITGDRLVSFVYLVDALPGFDADSPHAAFFAINDDRLAPFVRELSSLGNVSFGMLSAYEFTEL